jgi:hypothetical protein
MTGAKNETSQINKRLDARFNAYTILFVFFGTSTGMIMLGNVIAVGKA